MNAASPLTGVLASVTETRSESEETAVTSASAGRPRSVLEIVAVLSEPTRISNVSTVEISAGSVTVTATTRSGCPTELKVNTELPADAPLMLNVATPETGVADSSITTSELLDSTVTGWPEVKARSEFIVTTLAAAPVISSSEVMLFALVNALDFKVGSITCTDTTRSANPEPSLPNVRVVFPLFNPARANVALPADASTWLLPKALTTVLSATARFTPRPSSSGVPTTLDVIVTFFCVPIIRSSAYPFPVCCTSAEANDGVTSALAGTASPLTMRSVDIAAATTLAASERYEEGVTNKLSMRPK